MKLYYYNWFKFDSLVISVYIGNLVIRVCINNLVIKVFIDNLVITDYIDNSCEEVNSTAAVIVILERQHYKKTVDSWKENEKLSWKVGVKQGESRGKHGRK